MNLDFSVQHLFSRVIGAFHLVCFHSAENYNFYLLVGIFQQSARCMHDNSVERKISCWQKHFTLVEAFHSI